MKKEELKRITLKRIEEANVLLKNKKFDGAYYLAGYSLECAIKVCISNKFNNNEIPDKRFVQSIYTHDLNQLLKVADLDRKREEEELTSAEFAVNWAIIKDWSESSRYSFYTEKQAKELINSITAEKGGVLKWIQKYW